MGDNALVGNNYNSISENNIDGFIHLMNRIDDEELPQLLYHYTGKSFIEEIFKKDGISLKLTKASEFNDKLEGKCFSTFYNEALKELEEEHLIGMNERAMFSSLKPWERGFQSLNNAGNRLYSVPKSTETYVCCFSKYYMRPYMINQYVKDPKHQGICFGLESCILKNWNNRDRLGYIFDVNRVLYGREVINDLKSFIIDLMKLTNGSDTELFKMFGTGLPERKLAKVRYTSKSEEFKNENEYRIILQMPVGKNSGLGNLGIDVNDEGIFIRLKKNALWRYDFVNIEGSEKTNYEKHMKDCGYIGYKNDFPYL